MKIVMLARLFYPHVGGVEKHVEKLSLRLLRMGHEVTIITEQYDFDLLLEEMRGKIRILRIPVKDKKSLWKWMLANRRLFLEADLVHAHDVFWWYLPIRYLFPNKKIFITFHGYEGGLPTWKAVLHRKLADRLSFGSVCVGEYIKKWYHANPVLVTYGAADSVFVPRLGTGAVFAGRLSSDTGVAAYIKLFTLLKSVRKFDVYGDGPERSMIQKSGISFHGWKESVDFSSYRYVFSSQYLSILEAMQTGRLVVAVYNNEIKKDYLLCHPQAKNMIIAGSAEELADKLTNLSGTKEKAMIRRAYAWARKQTWDKLAKDYLKLWGVRD